MYSLFIDTHSDLITISLIKENDIFAIEKFSEKSHSTLLLTTLKEILEKKRINFKNIEKIIVVNGPGSFTGIRIGLSVVKIMGYVLNIPVIPVSSLTAFLVSTDTKESKLACIEDNKGYYISVFDKDNNIILDERYVEDITEYNSYYKVQNKLNIEKIINYCKNLKAINIHNLKANYIKKIEVEK